VRVAFLGNAPWSVPTLEALDADPSIEVSTVVTNPPRAAGRGSTLTPTAVATAAARLGLPCVEADGVRAGAGWEALRRAEPAAIVVVAYGELLTAPVLALAPLGCFNVHFSLLPRWRGAAPVQRALMAGDEVTGVTVIRLDEGLDTGPVIASRSETIRPDDDAGSLGRRLAAAGARLLVGSLETVAAGEAVAVPQDEALAVAAPKVARSERTIDWGTGARAIAGLVRALSPEPGATTAFRGVPFKIWRVEVFDPGPGGVPSEPGRIALVDGIPVVAVGEGAVALHEVGVAGRRPTGGAAWARGARLRPDERLG